MKSVSFILLFVLIISTLEAQVSIGGKPYSFKNELKPKSVLTKGQKSFEFQLQNIERLKQEDAQNGGIGVPYRYGIAFEVNMNLTNCGEWLELENDDRIWHLIIKCPSAKSINLSYDEFWLPDKSIFYIYNSTKSHTIGGFTAINNKGTKEKSNKFATGLVYGDEIILEYYEPKEVKGQGIISISNVIYGYRGIGKDIGQPKSFGGSGDCNVNINCSPYGDNWQDEKTSVAKIIFSGYTCSGSLINNTKENGIPYFLTANHCIAAVSLDAVTDPDASDWIYYWNYESSGCDDGTNFTTPSTTGSIVIANNSYSDFALMRLQESPYDLIPQLQLYFNGWDRTTNVSPSAVGIHHPSGDIKKICYENNTLTNSYPNWKVNDWDVGVTEGGSSGSPLYNSNSRVIGQLRGGSAACNGSTDNGSPDFYGMFSESWNYGSTNTRRLRDWLDPSGSGVNTLDGTYCTGTEYITNINFDADTTVNGCTINMQNVKVRNGANVTFDVAKDVIINGEFEVELGSEIEIK